MVLTNFDSLHEMVKKAPKKRMVIACANDEHTLEAAFEAREGHLCDIIAVGDAAKIRAICQEHKQTIADADIYDEADGPAACAKAVELVREGKADFIMKGLIDTPIILKAVVNKEHGLGQGRLMSHFTIFQIPNYHKLLTVVDGGMVTYPTLEQKKEIIENTVGVLRSLGYEKPKVGILACVEKVNPKMPETLDGQALQEMAERGEIKDCEINGPISYDCALVKEIADLKGYKGSIAGDADVLIVPNIHAGNFIGKSYTVTAAAKMAGFIVGAKCPIVLTSRGSSAEEKFLSIMLSAAASR
jgi:phosphate butyryltransferase